MVYRVLRRLDTGHEPGALVSGKQFSKKTIKILVQREAIAPVSAPPLEVLPGWTLRAERFGKVGIDAIAFLEMTDQAVSKATGANVKAIKKWRQDLKRHLGIGKTPAAYKRR